MYDECPELVNIWMYLVARSDSPDHSLPDDHPLELGSAPGFFLGEFSWQLSRRVWLSSFDRANHFDIFLVCYLVLYKKR